MEALFNLIYANYLNDVSNMIQNNAQDVHKFLLGTNGVLKEKISQH